MRFNHHPRVTWVALLLQCSGQLVQALPSSKQSNVRDNNPPDYLVDLGYALYKPTLVNVCIHPSHSSKAEQMNDAGEVLQGHDLADFIINLLEQHWLPHIPEHPIRCLSHRKSSFCTSGGTGQCTRSGSDRGLPEQHDLPAVQSRLGRSCGQWTWPRCGIYDPARSCAHTSKRGLPLHGCSHTHLCL